MADLVSQYRWLLEAIDQIQSAGRLATIQELMVHTGRRRGAFPPALIALSLGGLATWPPEGNHAARLTGRGREAVGRMQR